ncbi:hypothetical protein OAO65_02765 [Flavobacteriales bacterium]|nr:hypothetical protein [Flavobacteriales bacterium]
MNSFSKGFRKIITIRLINVGWTFLLFYVTYFIWVFVCLAIFQPGMDSNALGAIQVSGATALLPSMITFWVLGRKAAFGFFLAGRKRIARFRNPNEPEQKNISDQPNSSVRSKLIRFLLKTVVFFLIYLLGYFNLYSAGLTPDYTAIAVGIALLLTGPVSRAIISRFIPSLKEANEASD